MTRASLDFPHRQPQNQPAPKWHVPKLPERIYERVRVPLLPTRDSTYQPRLLSAQECYWCGLPFSADDPSMRRTREHLIPRSWGGHGVPDSHVAAHQRCNNERGCNLDWTPFSEHGRLGERGVFPRTL